MAALTFTVLIPHADLPGREGFFAEAKQSVLGQTRRPDQFLVAHDPEHTGAAATMNRALPKVTSEWIAQLGDDDYFLPNHLAVLETVIQAFESADERVPDVLYPDCRTLGLHSGALGGEFDPERLIRGNYIPGGGSLIRTAAVREVGGWCMPGDPDHHRYEDWIMLLRLHLSGYRIAHVPVTTWVYRFHSLATGGRVG